MPPPSDTPSTTTTTTTPSTSAVEVSPPPPPQSTNNSPSQSNPQGKEKQKEKPSKPRPTTSCSLCRIRKVKCNRQTPCSTCIARKTAHECTYTTTSAEREAIAAAETIAELRGLRDELRSRVVKTNTNNNLKYNDVNEMGDYHLPGTDMGMGGDVGVDSGRLRALEAFYAVLRDGEGSEVREVVGRVRAGLAVEEVVRGLRV
ncbi:hypothetical protein BJX61DRAFT_547359 [Aspergillus egyptiacus]|nr:hypothetical protein BJX61DRAFT_547359 [Aspergillus egyptiacus]